MSTKRKSEFAYSLPFAINVNTIGSPMASMPFFTPTSSVVPVLAEFDKTKPDPSGSRHLTSSAAFSEILASGSGPASFSFGHLDMSTCDISKGSGISKTRVFLFRVAEFEHPTTRVHNMKLWCSSITDFLTPEYAKVVYETHKTWKGDYSLPTSHLIDRTKWLPTSVPDEQNFLRQDGGLTIHASGDADVSEWAYVALAASGVFPLGQYGLTEASGLMFRVTFDADNMDVLFD